MTGPRRSWWQIAVGYLFYVAAFLLLGAITGWDEPWACTAVGLAFVGGAIVGDDS